MTTCPCGHPHEPDHTQRHNDWVKHGVIARGYLAKAGFRDVTELQLQIWQIIAWAHGGPKPDLTPEAEHFLRGQQ